jgi:exosortase/archaeosortase family protein
MKPSRSLPPPAAESRKGACSLIRDLPQRWDVDGRLLPVGSPPTHGLGAMAPAPGATAGSRPRRAAALAFVAALLALFPLTSRCPSFWLRGFSLPSAVLAAPFLGVSAEPVPDGYLLPNPHLPVKVTAACSAAGFLVLLVSLFAAMVVSAPPSRRWRLAAAVPPAAYAVTLAANAARIVLVWWADMAARAWLPPAMGPGVHYGAGLAVFLAVLIAAYAGFGWLVKQRRTG